MDVRVLLLTNEYPPHFYGGAGVHGVFSPRAGQTDASGSPHLWH